MDFGSVLRPDVYRLLIVSVLPGSTAVAPWVFGVLAPELQKPHVWSGGSGAVLALTLFLVALAVGTFLEDVGSRIEVALIDRFLPTFNPDDCGDLHEVWDQYLSLRTSDEIVGQRYLRNFLVRYKFELSMVTALPIGASGLTVAYCLGYGFDCGRTLAVIVAMVLATMFLAREAWCGGAGAHRVRGIIIRAVQASTPEQSDQPETRNRTKRPRTRAEK